MNQGAEKTAQTATRLDRNSVDLAANAIGVSAWVAMDFSPFSYADRDAKANKRKEAKPNTSTDALIGTGVYTPPLDIVIKAGANSGSSLVPSHRAGLLMTQLNPK